MPLEFFCLPYFGFKNVSNYWELNFAQENQTHFFLKRGCGT